MVSDPPPLFDFERLDSRPTIPPDRPVNYSASAPAEHKQPEFTGRAVFISVRPDTLTPPTHADFRPPALCPTNMQVPRYLNDRNLTLET